MSDQQHGGPPPHPDDPSAAGPHPDAPGEEQSPYVAPPEPVYEPATVPVEQPVETYASVSGEPYGEPAHAATMTTPEPVAESLAAPVAEPELETSRPPKKPASFLKELPILILIAFGLALLIKTFLIQAFYIPSESMVPTLNIGDRVLVNKVIYKIREPRRGEIVVFVGERIDRGPRSFWTRFRETLTSGLGGAQPAERDFIKRVIGLPGETVEIKDAKVTITRKDGSTIVLDEPYVSPVRDVVPFGPFKVPEGSYFVLGDNRTNSSDSRTALGPIRKSEIVGKAFVRIWPVKRFRALTRPGYAGGVAGAALIGFALVHRRRTFERRAA